ncbi:tigger transposable element-derived protein 6 [Ceratobasidium sp. AG-Ba]|nr:tigger transposable element-derived protein 6 [Ceratobasidium sp. AG-Ba]QRW08222.1 tigger transposable element-derived protein 6 [Ceratobasidium sp. AG-Ba]
MDETAVYGSLAPSAGLGTHDSGGLKPNPDRLTVALCRNEEGTHKLPILFIGHTNHPTCFPRYQSPSEMGYWYFNNPTAWMKYNVFKDFLADLNEAMRLENRYIILLCDNASSHKPPKKSPDDFRTLFPYPMDGGIIKSFKSQYQRRYVQLALLRSDEGNPRPYKLNQREVMQMATESWHSVSPTTIRNCWRHTGITMTQQAPELVDPAALVLYPEANPPDTAAELALQLGLVPEHTDPQLYDVLEALSFNSPTEEDLTTEQIFEELYPGAPFLSY